MSLSISLPFPDASRSNEPIWLADEPEQDLDFDEMLDEEEEASGKKPPYRRPVVYLLLLVLLVGGTYFLKPEWFFSWDALITSPASLELHDNPLASQDQQHETTSPAPEFHEGQLVAVTISPENPQDSITLVQEATGTELGPTVQAGDLLTILDGSFVHQTWYYQVHTKSGATGWIPGKQLKPQP